MKTFIVTIQLSHESYNGYDHKDGHLNYEVKARNADSARNKAKKLAKKTAPQYERDVISVSKKL